MVTGTAHIDELISKAHELNQDPSPEAQLLTEKALALAEKEQYSKGIAETLTILGWRSYLQGNLTQMLDQSERALTLAEELQDKPIEAAACNNIGIVHFHQGNYTLALDFWKRALELRRQEKNYHRIGSLLINIGNVHYYSGEFSKAHECFSQSLALAEETNNRQSIADSFEKLGTASYAMGDYSKAYEYLMSSVAIFEEIGDKHGAALSLGHIGLLYLTTGDLSRALDFSLRALSLQEEVGNTRLVASVLNSIGGIYGSLHNHTKALEFFFRALPLAEESGDVKNIASIAGHIGLAFIQEGKYREALEYLHRTLEINQQVGSSPGVATALLNIGTVHRSAGDFAPALEKYEHAHTIFREINDRHSLAATIGNIGELYAQKKFAGYDTEKAEEYLLQALVLAQELGEKHNEMQRHKGLADLYEQLELWDKFAFHFKKFYDLEKEIHSEESLKKITQLETQRQLAEIEKEREVERTEQRATYQILHKIFPHSVVERIRAGESPLGDHYPSATILFLDLVDFTSIAAHIPPRHLLYLLNSIFDTCDEIIAQFGLEKIKTIGDAYMAASGIPEQTERHVENAVLAAVALLKALKDLVVKIPQELEGDRSWIHNLGEIHVRIGLHCGEVVGGVIGSSKYSYDLWGDTVNIAARMESSGAQDKIHVSEEVFKKLQGKFSFKERGEIDIKGKGKMRTYFLNMEI